MDENQTQIDQERAEEVIKQRILIVRECRVMIDADLAKLYGVTTKAFNQAVRRNMSRFPENFMFQLLVEEVEFLNRSQIVTGSQKHRDPRYLPYVFTEYGVAMLSSVLKSEKAIQMNIFIIQAFLKMRESLETNKDLAIKIGEIESKQKDQGKILETVHNVVKHLIEKPKEFKGKVGFN